MKKKTEKKLKNNFNRYFALLSKDSPIFSKIFTVYVLSHRIMIKIETVKKIFKLGIFF
jgi:hypothetical protein